MFNPHQLDNFGRFFTTGLANYNGYKDVIYDYNDPSINTGIEDRHKSLEDFLHFIPKSQAFKKEILSEYQQYVKHKFGIDIKS